jgi:hypothetical protein
MRVVVVFWKLRLAAQLAACRLYCHVKAAGSSGGDAPAHPHHSHPESFLQTSVFALRQSQQTPTTMSGTVEITSPSQLSTLLSSSRIVVLNCKTPRHSPSTSASAAC